jgi:hypothetical protein
VKRVLLTGMSGTGKSSVIQALAARGFKAVDTDDGWCKPFAGAGTAVLYWNSPFGPVRWAYRMGFSDWL